MKRNIARKPTRGTKTATENSGFVQVSLVATTTASNGQELADIVWKYFGEQISKTLVEVQESLAVEQTDPSPQIRHRKRQENEQSA